MPKSRRRRRRGLFLIVVLVALGYFLTTEQGSDWLQKAYYRVDHVEIIRTRCRELRLDPYLVSALIFTESRFRKDAVSEVGAVGLMQLMPETAQDMAQLESLPKVSEEDLLEPGLNIRLGTRYLSRLLRRFDSEEFALAAYNAGPGVVDEWLETDSKVRYPETRAYISEILKHRRRLRNLYPEWERVP